MAAKFHISQWANQRTNGDKKPFSSAAGKAGKKNQQQEAKNAKSNLFEKLRVISPDIIFILDTDRGTIQYLNGKEENSNPLATSFQQERSNDFFHSFKPEDRQRFLEVLENFVATEWEKDFREIELSVGDSFDPEKIFNIRFTPHSINGPNRVNEWFCQARDITAEKKSLKAEQDSRLKLQMALDGSNMGIWSYDPLSQKMDCDDRACSIFGLTKEEIREDVNKIFQRIHPEDRNHAFHIAFNTLRRKGRFNHDIRVITPGQSIIKHIAVIGELITNEKAEVTKVTGICLDISQNKLADIKMKTSETFLEESQKIAKIGGFEWDLILDKLQMTRQMYYILDISSDEEFSLEYFYSRVFQPDLPNVKAAIQRSVKDGKPFSEEFRYKRKDGSLKVLWAQSKIDRREEKTCRITGTIQDITEKKEKEKELNTQNLLIRSILDHLPVFITIVNKHWKIKRLLGPTGLGRLGMLENEKVGQSVQEAFPSSAPHIEKVLKGETVNFYQELTLKGRKFHLLSFFFYDSDRELAIGFSIDITAQKKAEAAFQKISVKNQELERINKVMDMFVYAVAHDLKNPINNLEMLQTLMDEALQPDEKQSYKEAFKKSVKRLKQTVKGLVEIIELENSRNFLPLELDFAETLEHVQADLQAQLQGKNGTIEAIFHEPRIFYNQAFLTSIFKNLISNAIKYSKAGIPPHIKIETKKKGAFILLTIKDNGIGIDLQQYGENLFKPFKRFNKKVEGTGVGLHLVKSMVEKNGGYIQVESMVGEGTTFCCYLKPTNI